MLVIGISFCGQIMAQGGVGSLLKKVGTFIDSMSVRGVDRSYIDAPEKPWQLIVKGNVSQTIVSMRTEGSMAGHDYSAKPSLKTTPAQYVGLWAGYRGYGFGYTVNVGGDKGSYLTVGATGGAFGINVRIHSFDNSNPDFNLNSSLLSEDQTESWNDVHLTDPIRVKTIIADGYYMFNGKKFSYAAAYDQSLVQLRSAGSFVAGARYFHSNYDYAHDSNADIILNMNNIGRIRTWQVSIGAGYAYNWVPAKGWLFSIIAMPMVTAYNHIKIDTYDSNYRQLALDEVFHEDDELPRQDYRITPMGTESHNSRIQLNVNSRASLTYSASRWFVNLNGNLYHSRYRYHSNSGHLNDWSVNANVGIRF